jgi:signal transduction histidine kinase
LTPEETDEALRSLSPVDRAKATAWLKQQPAAASTLALMRALQRESIPRLRRALNEIIELRQITRPSSTESSEPNGSNNELQVSGESLDVAALIRHELSPAIGWIRLAANKEIENFATSETDSAVRKLQRRINGLVALAKESQELEIQPVSFPAVLVENWPHPAVKPTFEPTPETAGIEIHTDNDLLSLLLSNVYQNAIDASTEATGTPAVHIAWGFTGHDYWARVNNPFDGNRFSIDDVSAVGHSSKTAHQGHGMELIKSVAARLSMSISLEGTSGIASFSLSGARSHE